MLFISSVVSCTTQTKLSYLPDCIPYIGQRKLGLCCRLITTWKRLIYSYVHKEGKKKREKNIEFNYRNFSFTLLNVLQPLGRYFHSAVSTKNYMLVMGGRTNPDLMGKLTEHARDNVKNERNITMMAYDYTCNLWIAITSPGQGWKCYYFFWTSTVLFTILEKSCNYSLKF